MATANQGAAGTNPGRARPTRRPARQPHPSRLVSATDSRWNRPPFSWRALKSALVPLNELLIYSLLLSSLGHYQLAGAKTHHSKRQAPGEQLQLVAQQPTGRESTNWWNLWWQQYINEAAQPTIRPIVSLTFDGQTIRARQQPAEGAPADGSEPLGERENSVPTELDSADGKPLGGSPASRAAQRAQLNWQSVKPRMLHMQQRDVRQNRQIPANQPAGDEDEAREPAQTFGIQMRANQQRHRQQQQPAAASLPIQKAAVSQPIRSFVAPNTNQLLQQQQQQLFQIQLEDLGRFEQQQQQQHQMSDYIEEPDLESIQNVGGAGETPPADGQPRKPTLDSSSSSMMMPDDELARQAAKTEADRGRATGAQDGGRAKTSSATGSAKQQPGPEATANAGPAATGDQDRPVGGAVAPTTSKPTSAISGGGALTTPAPAASESAGEENARETPISLEGDRTTPPVTTTSSGNRVALQNGRPASGRQQPTGTTTSARLPTPSRAATAASTSSAGQQQPGAQTDQTRGSEGQSASQAPVTTTTSSVASQPGRGQSASTPSPATGEPSSTTTTSLRPSGAPTTTTAKPGAQTASGRTELPGATVKSSGDANGTATATTAADEEDGEEDSDEDGATGSGLLISEGGDVATTADESDGSSSASDSSDDEDEDESNEPTTTTTTGRPTSAGASQAGGTTGAGFTSQPPALTTIDIERLPKGGDSGTASSASPAPTTSGSAGDKLGRVQEASTTTTSAPPTTTTTTTTTTSTSAPPRQPKPTSPNVLMVSLDDASGATTMEGETAITMPVEAIMRMMLLNNQLLADEENNRRRQQADRAPGGAAEGATNQPTAAIQTNGQQIASFTPTPSSATSESGRPRAPSRQEQSGATGQQQASGAKKKLQPPPTTRLPDSLAPSAPTTQRQQTQRPPELTVATQAPAASAGPSRDETSGGSGATSAGAADSARTTPGEAKIELINMDLAPIQRIMSSTTPPGAATAQQGEQQRPKLVMKQMGETKQAAGSSEASARAQQVEPGMRLRPPTWTGSSATTPSGAATTPLAGRQPKQQQQQQRPSASGARPQAPQLMASSISVPEQGAKTIYMIMMNAPQQPQQSPAASSAPPPQTPAPASETTPRKPATSTTTAQQQATSATRLTIGQPQSTPTARPPSTSTTSKQAERLTAGPTQSSSDTAADQQQRRTSAGSTTTPVQQQQQASSTSTGRPTGEQRDRPGVAATTRGASAASSAAGIGASQSGRSSSLLVTQSAGPASEQTPATTTTASTPIEREGSPRTTPGQPLGGPQTSSTAGAKLRQKQQQQQLARPAAAAGATPFPAGEESSPARGQTSSDTAQLATGTTPAGPADEIQRQGAGQTSADRSPLQQTVAGSRPDEPRTTSTAPTTTTRRPQQQQQPSPGTKSGKLLASGVKSANASSLSFIPNKLRNDFGGASGRGQHQQATAGAKFARLQLADADLQANQTSAAPANGSSWPETPSSVSPLVQSLAIRQFGGANRMSALANQPVAFGRPATMMMGGEAAAAAARRQPAVPSFEYGPAIAVRRPDEPLANGQMPNCTLTGKNFCVLTKDYPMNEVRQAVERSFRSVRIMYEELQTVSDQELHKEDYLAANSSANQLAASGKFACQTQVEMMRPGWAKDEITKEWMLVVNTDVFPQRVRTESCAQPNTPCEFIAPFYDSTCQQRYSLHRMIAIDPHDSSRSPQVAVFRFPAGCVCRVHPIKKSSSQISKLLAAASPAPVTTTAAAAAAATTTSTSTTSAT